jgi:hypothetical protein
MPGPHGLAVRKFTFVRVIRSRLRALAAHRFPHSTYRDDAYVPLHEAGWAEDATDLGAAQSGLFFAGDLDRGDDVEWTGEISFEAQVIFNCDLTSRKAGRTKALPLTS